MRNKKLMLFSLTGNLLVFLSSLAGVLWYYLSLAPEAYGQGKTYFYYTINSNILVCLTSLLAIICIIICFKKQNDTISRVIHVIKFAGVTCVTLTFTTVMFWIFSGTFATDLLVGKFSAFLHLVTPILAFLTFMLFDHNYKKLKWIDTVLVLIPTFIYGLIYITIVCFIGNQDYNIYLFGVVDGEFIMWRGLITFPILLVVAFAIANLLFGLNLLFRKLFYKDAELVLEAHEEIFGVNVIDEQAEKQAEKEAEKKRKEEELAQVREENRIEKENQKARDRKAKNLAKRELNPQNKPKTKEKTSNPTDYKDGPRIYHISRSKNQDGMWQVKLATGEKAVKLFPTQKEAIDYAKSLVASNGGSIRIHSLKGKIRK